MRKLKGGPRDLPHLRLISDEQFYAAQIILDENVARVAARRKDKGKLGGSSGRGDRRHMLAGLIECGICGALFNTCGSNAKYMGCPKYKKGVCKCRTTLPRGLAEKFILNAVLHQLRSIADWKNQTYQLMVAAIQKQAQDSPNTLSHFKKSLAEIQQMIVRIIDEMEKRDHPSLGERLEKRTREKKDLERQIRAAERQQLHTVAAPTREWFEQRLTETAHL